jgi:hypothetical protein
MNGKRIIIDLGKIFEKRKMLVGELSEIVSQRKKNGLCG